MMKQKLMTLALALTAILMLTSVIAPPVVAASITIVIGEFRTRGPNGGNDEFIELYNLSTSSVDISGWMINGSNNAGTTSTRATIPAGTILAPYQHYLLTNSSTTGGPYSGSTTGNQTYSTGITDDGGIALLDASSAIVDQVGMSAGSAYKEGTVLTPTTTNQNQSYARLPDTLSQTGGHKNGIDTDNNSADFLFNASTSSPENSSSPLAITLRTLSATNNALDLALPLTLALVSAFVIIALRRRSRTA
jgi:hypothetical protein